MAVKLWMFITVVILVSNGNYAFAQSDLDSDDACESTGRRGSCLILTQCEPLLTLLQTSPRPIPNSIKSTLQAATCGFVGALPKVCCQLRSAAEVTTPPITKPTVRPTPTVTPTSTASVGYFSEPPEDITGHPNLPLITNDNCGIVEQDRILGGNKTGLIEMPWMILIAYTSRNRLDFRCGGTVINEWYILTAAHCVTNLSSRMKLAGIRVGEHDMTTSEDCEGTGDDRVCNPPVQDFAIAEVTPHPEYSPSKLQNDIALIRVDGPIDLSVENAKPICLPVTRDLQLMSFENKRVIVAGWGATETGTESPDLLKVDLMVVSNPACGKIHNKSIAAGISYKQICAGGSNGKDSCGGDSGGPMKYPVALWGTARYMQLGIVSFGPKRCGATGFPGVYTRVAYYMKWILDNIKS